MAVIKQLKDNDTNVKIYPITHVDAVLNPNGNTINEELTYIRSNINDVAADVDNVENMLSNINPDLVTPVTYHELVLLRDKSKLIPGMMYRITDYQCTTTQENTQSAGHQFDIIVTATDVNTLNENAKAVKHEGDTYFANSNLDAWEVWYCLDNDANRFAWANGTNGKGVIYRLIDEFNNDCPYDFKNIQFKRKLTDGVYDLTNGTNTWVYTFNYWNGDNAVCLDSSIVGNTNQVPLEDAIYGVHDNKIVPCIDENYDMEHAPIRQLNDNVFLDSSSANEFYWGTYNNVLGQHCNSNTFGNGCYDNTFGKYCYRNTLGNNCYSNTFGDDCSANTFGNDCYNSTFGHSFSNGAFGNDCTHNTFGNNCNFIRFANADTGTPNSYYQYITIEDNVQYVLLRYTGTLNSNNYLQNIKICTGVKGTNNSYKQITHPTVNDTFQTIYRNDEEGTTEGGIVALKSDIENLDINTKNVVAATNSFTTSTTTPLPNDNVYINHVSNDTVKSSLKIYGSYGVNVIADSSANISVEHATKGLLHNTFGYYAIKTDDYGHTTVGEPLSYQYINQITNFNYIVIKDSGITDFDSSILED